MNSVRNLTVTQCEHVFTSVQQAHTIFTTYKLNDTLGQTWTSSVILEKFIAASAHISTAEININIGLSVLTTISPKNVLGRIHIFHYIHASWSISPASYGSDLLGQV